MALKIVPIEAFFYDRVANALIAPLDQIAPIEGNRFIIVSKSRRVEFKLTNTVRGSMGLFYRYIFKSSDSTIKTTVLLDD